MKPEKFKDALTILGWSQAEFARRAGLDATTVSRWMQGHSPIPRLAEQYLTLAVRLKELLDDI